MSSQTENAVINLVINGQQAMATYGELNKARREQLALVQSLKQTDPGYKDQLTRLTAITAAEKARRAELINTRVEQKGFFADFKEGFSEITEMAGKITAGTLIYKGVSAIIKGVKGLINGSVEAYDEAQRTQTQLQQVIKTTGGVAGETQKQLEQYQKTLMDQTGIDDDVIAKGEEMLLTFTNIRGKIYEQALPAIVDMTAAMNGGKVSMEGIQATAIQVGKALNDPVNGATALKKVGVTLSEQQKEQIKTMQENNNMMGAQAVILKELQKEFGGTAKAVADTDVGAMQKFETRIGNIKESIGALLVGGKSLMADFLSPFLGLLEKFLVAPVAEKLHNEQTELNVLVGAIVSTNENQAVRNTLIAKLQEKYPEFIGNIDKESASNELLTRRLAEANEQYRLKIFIATNEEKIKDIQDRRNKALKDEADARERVAKATGMSATALAQLTEEQLKNIVSKSKDDEVKRLLSSANPNIGAGGSVQSSSLALRDYNLIVNGKKNLIALDKEEADLMSANAIYQDKVTQQRVKDIDKEVSALQKKMAVEKDEAKKSKDQSEIDRLTQEKNGLLGIVVAPTSGKTKAELDAEAKKAEQRKKEQQAYADGYAALTEKLKQFEAGRLLLTMSANEKEVQQLENTFDTEIVALTVQLEKLKRSKYKNATEIAAAQASIDKLTQEKSADVAALREKQEKDLNDKIIAFKDQLTGKMGTELERQTIQINKFYDDLAKNSLQDQATQDEIQRARLEALNIAKLNATKSFEEEKAKIEETFALGKGNKDDTQRAAINKHWDDIIRDLKQKFKDQPELDAFIKKLNGERTSELNDVGKDKNPNTISEFLETLTPEEKAKQLRDTTINVAQETANAVFQIGQANRQRETDMAIAALEKQKDAELSAKNLTEAQKKAINDKYARLEANAKLKQWEADQTAAEESAILQGAVNVVKSFPNPLEMAAAVALTAVQVATIASQKPPQFADGGILPNGPSHASGGINLVGPYGAIYGQIEGGEPVLSRATYANNKGVIDALLNSGGRQLDYDAVVAATTSREARRSVSTATAGPRSGASPATATNNSRQDTRSANSRLDRLEALMEKQLQVNQIPVVWSDRIMEEKKNRNIQIINNAKT